MNHSGVPFPRLGKVTQLRYDRLVPEGERELFRALHTQGKVQRAPSLTKPHREDNRL